VPGPLALAALSLVLLAAGCSGSSSRNDDLESAAQAPVSQSQSGTTSGTGSTGGDAPSVSLSASALEINEGGSVSLSWSADNADGCTASGGWSGSLATSGSQNVGPLSAGTTFSLSCSGPGGSALEMLSVAVIGPVELSWVAPEENVDGSALTDLAGYRIYYGTSTRSYSDRVDLSDPAATAHTLTLASGDYYVAMTALDGEGNESGYSNEVVKTRL
jgi:hypothetical protein